MKSLSRGRKVVRSGKNSLAVNIPPSIAKAAQILSGDIITVDIGEGMLGKEIRIRKMEKRPENDFEVLSSLRRKCLKHPR